MFDAIWLRACSRNRQGKQYLKFLGATRCLLVGLERVRAEGEMGERAGGVTVPRLQEVDAAGLPVAMRSAFSTLNAPLRPPAALIAGPAAV